MLYKQVYLELLEKQEYEKVSSNCLIACSHPHFQAYSYLTKRLKPLESRQLYPEEFRDLCVLLTSTSVSVEDMDVKQRSSR